MWAEGLNPRSSFHRDSIDSHLHFRRQHCICRCLFRFSFPSWPLFVMQHESSLRVRQLFRVSAVRTLPHQLSAHWNCIVSCFPGAVVSSASPLSRRLFNTSLVFSILFLPRLEIERTRESRLTHHLSISASPTLRRSDPPYLVSSERFAWGVSRVSLSKWLSKCCVGAVYESRKGAPPTFPPLFTPSAFFRLFVMLFW